MQLESQPKRLTNYFLSVVRKVFERILKTDCFSYNIFRLIHIPTSRNRPLTCFPTKFKKKKDDNFIILNKISIKCLPCVHY